MNRKTHFHVMHLPRIMKFFWICMSTKTSTRLASRIVFMSTHTNYAKFLVSCCFCFWQEQSIIAYTKSKSGQNHAHGFVVSFYKSSGGNPLSPSPYFDVGYGDEFTKHQCQEWLAKQQEQTLTEQTKHSKHRYFASLRQRSSGVEI